MSSSNVHYQINPGKFVSVESFSSWNNTAYEFSLEDIEDNKLVKKISAEKAVWDSTFNGWKLKNYFIREYTEGLQDRVTTGAELDTVLNLTVTDFYRNKKTVETLPAEQLDDVDRHPEDEGDANVMYALIEKHNRLALPFWLSS